MRKTNILKRNKEGRKEMKERGRDGKGQKMEGEMKKTRKKERIQRVWKERYFSIVEKTGPHHYGFFTVQWAEIVFKKYIFTIFKMFLFVISKIFVQYNQTCMHTVPVKVLVQFSKLHIFVWYNR
ncbi:hypothetical protein XENORESO_006925 [Xenotaenia resolanae]|uniref:Uncharacterized protein n=1 Tax=Xenotaenia resolanae TaxID=208358 RepID=A0ABV0X280_9TELE